MPGVSTLSRLGSSAPADTRVPSALSRMMARSTEVVANESIVATWVLKRGKEWKEVRRVMQTSVQPRKRFARVAKPEYVILSISHCGIADSSCCSWLAQAELSTYSHSTRIVPRSIYLSHQFAFFTLGEDYHGLLRSHTFDVPSTKVEVRRQIEVSASGSGSNMSESFISGSSVPSQSGISSSFDDAVSADMRYLNPSPPVLPMYPNGPPSRAYRNAIPIRTVAAGISDGMSEGLGRLRRELGKVRSPRLAPQRDSTRMPIEFDEEDEDFAPRSGGLGLHKWDEARSSSREGASVSTPSTGMEPLLSDDDDGEFEGGSVGAWHRWGPEEKQAVEEVEQFDDIAVGFMDEELIGTVRRR
jgi:hypothetical protein